MRPVRLMRADLRMMDAAIEGDAALARVLGLSVAEGWAAAFPGALGTARRTLAQSPAGDRWGTHLLVAGRPGEVVGWGGFKGSPRDGVVELGYEVAVGHRGRGTATAATLAMLEQARADRDVTTVIAHTLPGPGASTRVLAKAGFALDGHAREHGEPVWRFSCAVVDRPPG